MLSLLDEAEAVLSRLEPYLDAIVCYASSMDEHEPNRIAFDARALLAKLAQARVNHEPGLTRPGGKSLA